jgi:hypothetical protein
MIPCAAILAIFLFGIEELAFQVSAKSFGPAGEMSGGRHVNIFCHEACLASPVLKPNYFHLATISFVSAGRAILNPSDGGILIDDWAECGRNRTVAKHL